jgi:hypothetical protein
VRTIVSAKTIARPLSVTALVVRCGVSAELLPLMVAGILLLNMQAGEQGLHRGYRQASLKRNKKQMSGRSR